QRADKQSKGGFIEYTPSRAGNSASSSVGTTAGQSPDPLSHGRQHYPTKVGGRPARKRAAKQETASVECSTVAAGLALVTCPVVAGQSMAKMVTIFWYT